MKQYIVASTLDWYQNVPGSSIYDSPHFIHVESQDEFNALDLETLSPEFIFFIHWNWIVSETIFSKYPCIVFSLNTLFLNSMDKDYPSVKRQ